MSDIKTIDLLSCGELLIDMISADFAETMYEAELFKRLPGGSPANLCMNMKRLGKHSQLVAAVGNDEMGSYLLRYVKNLGLAVDTIGLSTQSTTLILVTRSKNVSGFEAYRGADCEIEAEIFTDELLQQVKIFHTTCFALSRQPAQKNILSAAKRAVQLGARLSIDVNYAQKIWPDQAEARRIVASYAGMGAFIKSSEVDWERLYNRPLSEPDEAIDFYLKIGAKEVCITLGSDGCKVGDPENRFFVSARKVEVKDTTGAGDAFWSGYLTARLDGHAIEDAAKAGRSMAELKLGHFGPLPSSIDPSIIYQDFIAN